MKDKLKEKYPPESYRNRLLADKLDHMLRLAQNCNSCLRRIESRIENRHDNIVPSDDVDNSRVVADVSFPPMITSVIKNALVNSDTLFLMRSMFLLRILVK